MRYSYGDTFEYSNHDDAMNFVYAHRLLSVPIELLRKGDRIVATRSIFGEHVVVTGVVASDGRHISFLKGYRPYDDAGKNYINVKVDGADYSGNHPNQTFYDLDGWTFRVAKPVFDLRLEDQRAIAKKLQDDEAAAAKRSEKEAKLEKLLEQIADLNKKADELRDEL